MIFKFFVILVAILHCLFFKLESIDFMKEKVLKRFGLSIEQGRIVKIWAFNQGFYNLFLAIGLFYSIWVGDLVGLYLARYILIFIVAAGVVLIISSPKKYKAGMIQLVPALLGFISSFL